ncbi:MAG: integrin alpha, partial [Limisphaerales bacterium]
MNGHLSFSRYFSGWVVVFFFLFSVASGQNLLYQKNGSALDSRLGFSVAGAGDVNGDGRADFIVGAPYADPAGVFNAGSASV